MSAYGQSPPRVAAEKSLEQYLPAERVGDIPAHSVTSETATSILSGLSVLFRYRSTKNFQSGAFIGPRLGDKIFFAFILFSMYIFVGSKRDPASCQNTVSALFMMTTLPAFGAASYGGDQGARTRPRVWMPVSVGGLPLALERSARGRFISDRSL